MCSAISTRCAISKLEPIVVCLSSARSEAKRSEAKRSTAQTSDKAELWRQKSRKRGGLLEPDALQSPHFSCRHDDRVLQPRFQLAFNGGGGGGGGVVGGQ